MIELAIFDLDGTLLYTVEDIAAATNHALAACGYPVHSVDTIAGFIGNGINKLFERALPEEYKNQEEVLRIRSLFIPFYDLHGAERSRPFRGIPELLRDLDSQGVKIAVASNKYHSATARLIPHFFPDIEFSAVLGQREGFPAKPDPGIVYEIISSSGLSLQEKENCIYIGDSGVDMQTAANSGLTAVGVTWGCRPRSELEKYSPAYIVDTPEEIGRIISCMK